MRTLLSVLLLLLLPVLALGQVQTFRKEVKQVMGSAMSQDDARVAAIAKAKRDALEEAGTWLESVSEVKNANLLRDDVTALASGITQTRIITEEPLVENGIFAIRVVAEVRVDNSGLGERVSAFLRNRSQLEQAKAVNAREQQLLMRLTELERQMEDMRTASAQDKARLRVAVEDNTRGLTAGEWFDKGAALSDGTKSKDPQRAITYYSEALRLDPSFAAAYNNRGIAYGNLDQYQRAIDDFDQALRVNPSNSTVLMNRGVALGQLNRYQEALLSFDQALRLNPASADSWHFRGLTHMNMGQHGRAVEDFSQALRLQPEAAVYGLRGTAYSELGEYKRSIEDLDRAVSMHPEFQYYFFRGISLVGLGQYDRAIDDYTEGLRLNPASATAYAKRGDALVLARKFDRAIEDYSQALKIDAVSVPVSYVGRAIAYMKIGDIDGARLDFLKACEVGIPEACSWLKKNPK